MPPPGLANLSPRKCEKLIACIFLFIESSFTVFFNENQLLEQTFTTPSTITNGKKFLFESECTISTKFYSLPEDSYTDTFLKLGRGRVWHLIFISMINTLFGNTSGMFSFRWHSFQTILRIFRWTVSIHLLRDFNNSILQKAESDFFLRHFGHVNNKENLNLAFEE